MQIALSTMWAKGRFKRMTDFTDSLRRLGFTAVEPNSTLLPGMLDELITLPVPISSLHAPCPASRTAKGIPAASLSLAALDDEERQEALLYTRKTIELAVRVGARVVIIYLGGVPLSQPFEERLRQLYRAGASASQEYREIREQLINERRSSVPFYLDTAFRSLEDLSKYAGDSKVMLGLETRVHYHEIPGFEEMARMLDMTDPGVVGYWHDVGHAEVQSRLGLTPHEDWLKRFQDKMTGIHLHDIIGLTDHLIPGRGEMDWDMIAPYLTRPLIKTCEIDQRNEPEDMTQIVSFLQRKNII